MPQFKVYSGQTGRMLEQRLKEHKRALTSGNVSQLVVAEHAMNEPHTIKWEEVEVANHHASTLPAEMCFRSMAHPDRVAQNEPR